QLSRGAHAHARPGLPHRQGVSADHVFPQAVGQRRPGDAPRRAVAEAVRILPADLRAPRRRLAIGFARRAPAADPAGPPARTGGPWRDGRKPRPAGTRTGSGGRSVSTVGDEPPAAARISLVSADWASAGQGAGMTRASSRSETPRKRAPRSSA